ncbi:hypothetical protein J7J90_02385 [Candidatus Micrarchaeota archaeon]|nr:hypothetical protein [Candidatus Micrarchaeota archaeon]
MSNKTKSKENIEKEQKEKIGMIYSTTVKYEDIQITLQRIENARKNHDWKMLNHEDVNNLDYALITAKETTNKILESLILISKNNPELINDKVISDVIDVIKNADYETLWRGVSILTSIAERGHGEKIIPYIDDLSKIKNSKQGKEQKMIGSIFRAMLYDDKVRKEILPKMINNYDTFKEILEDAERKWYNELLSYGLIKKAQANDDAYKLLKKVLNDTNVNLTKKQIELLLSNNKTMSIGYKIIFDKKLYDFVPESKINYILELTMNGKINPPVEWVSKNINDEFFTKFLKKSLEGDIKLVKYVTNSLNDERVEKNLDKIINLIKQLEEKGESIKAGELISTTAKFVKKIKPNNQLITQLEKDIGFTFPILTSILEQNESFAKKLAENYIQKPEKWDIIAKAFPKKVVTNEMIDYIYTKIKNNNTLQEKAANLIGNCWDIMSSNQVINFIPLIKENKKLGNSISLVIYRRFEEGIEKNRDRILKELFKYVDIPTVNLLIKNLGTIMGNKLDLLHENEKKRTEYLNSLKKHELLAVVLCEPKALYTSSNNMVLDKIKEKGGLYFIKEIGGSNIINNDIINNFTYKLIMYGRYNDIPLEKFDILTKKLINSLLVGDYTSTNYTYLSEIILTIKDIEENPSIVTNKTNRKLTKEDERNITDMCNRLLKNISHKIDTELTYASGRKKYGLEYLNYLISNKLPEKGKKIIKKIEDSTILNVKKFKEDGVIRVVHIFDYENAKWADDTITALKKDMSNIKEETKNDENYTIIKIKGTVNDFPVEHTFCIEKDTIFDRNEWEKYANNADIIMFRGHSYNLNSVINPGMLMPQIENKDSTLLWFGSCNSAFDIPIYSEKLPFGKVQFIGNKSTGYGQKNIDGIEYLIKKITKLNEPVRFQELNLPEHMNSEDAQIYLPDFASGIVDYVKLREQQSAIAQK